LVYIWQLKEQYVGLDQVIKDWEIIAWSAKWLDEPASKIMYCDVRNKKEKAILQPLWRLLDDADIVITQNGQSFDGPKLNARFIQLGFGCPSPYQHLDTYRIAKRVFEFTSNKLEYLTDKLCVKYKKLKHKKFGGLSLWKECLKGNVQAWKEMKKYNIHDVLSTEEMYNKLKAWAPETMPKPYQERDNKKICGVCGGGLKSWGIRHTNLSSYRRLRCQSCGAFFKGEKVK